MNVTPNHIAYAELQVNRRVVAARNARRLYNLRRRPKIHL